MSSRFHRWSFIAVSVSSAAAIAACSSSTTSTGQSGRPAGTAAPVEAAKSTFCDDLGSSVQVLDRYGRVFDEAPTTVGQLESAAAELTAAQDKVKASGAALADSISAANRASAASAGTASTTTTVLQTKTADEHVATISAAEKNLRDTVAGIDASTTVRSAAAELQAAAFGVEQAYVSLFVDAGCLVENASAARAVDAYVKGLQQDLTTLGYFSGPVDGLYGPQTVAAVKALQASASLPQTGVLDPATEVAMSQQLAAKGAQQSLNIAAIQGALTASGHYTGPIDGMWTPALEQAISSYQQSQNLPTTGALDAATLSALLGVAQGSASSSTPATSSAPSTTTTVTATTSTAVP